MARKSRVSAPASKAPAKKSLPAPDSESESGSGDGAKDESSDDDDGAFDLGLENFNSSEADSDESDDFGGGDDDSEEEDGVAYDSADGSGSEHSDDGSDNDSDDDNELKRLVDNLDPQMRQRVLQKKGQESDSEKSDGSEEEEEESWGKKKKTYWEGDTGDLEIGQDFEDAEDEEAAAMDLNMQKLKRMTDADFYDDSFEGPVVGADSSSKKKKGGAARANIEKLNKDVSSLTRDQRLELLAANSPELAGLVEELKERVAELKSRVVPACESLNKINQLEGNVDDDIVDYLEVKQQILLSYCVNIVFYLYMKAQGKSVRSHPVMKQLLKLRYVMEKLRPLDGKLKFQIDRLLKSSVSDEAENAPSSKKITSSLRPNPAALLAKGGSSGAWEGADSEEEDDVSDDSDASDVPRGRKVDKAEVYKAPKMTAMPYSENESKDAKKERKLEAARKKMKNSEIMQSIREEFGDNPETAASDGITLADAGDARALAEEAAERREWEESNFVRRVLTRKEKKSIKKRADIADRLDNFDDIGDIGEFERLAELTSGFAAPSAAAAAENDPMGMGGEGRGSTSSMRRAVNALSRGGAAVNIGGGGDDSDDDGEDPFGEMLRAHGGGAVDSGRKRRRAPDEMFDSGMTGDFGSGDDDDADGSLVADFAKKKKAFLAKKKEHYTAEPRYGGYEDVVEEGKKRAISYEIMKNKGLTKHRKKEDRNARVKKRNKYDKAVIARKGQVVQVKTGEAGRYGGEVTGIKANLARSRKLEHSVH